VLVPLPAQHPSCGSLVEAARVFPPGFECFPDSRKAAVSRARSIFTPPLEILARPQSFTTWLVGFFPSGVKESLLHFYTRVFLSSGIQRHRTPPLKSVFLGHPAELSWWATPFSGVAERGRTALSLLLMGIFCCTNGYSDAKPPLSEPNPPGRPELTSRLPLACLSPLLS